MSEVTHSSKNQQVYRVHTGDTLMMQVSRVIFVLLPRGICIAGFSDRGDLLTIHYNDYKKSLPAWIIDFFEHEFLNDSLLASPHKVVGVFIASDKTMLVPEVIYNESEATQWLNKLNFVEGNEVVSTHELREDKAHYVYSWPAAMKSLINRYFSKAKVMPFAAYQFYKPFKSECSLQICITNNEVFATLYKNRTLNWHQVFGYQTAEDIAYRLKHVCKHYNVDEKEMVFQCTVANKNLATIITELTQYFPDLKDGSSNVAASDRSWTATVYLLQQLYACAL